jgi:hypothetical protein
MLDISTTYYDTHGKVTHSERICLDIAELANAVVRLYGDVDDVRILLDAMTRSLRTPQEVSKK